ncbi:MAG: Hpt domain-containing protein [Methylococcaceae bacterium]
MDDEFDILLKQLRDEFVAVFPERCDSLEERVLAFEQGHEGAFDDIYRRVHSLKGSGSQFGLSIVTSICHQFESFLSSGALTNNSLSLSFALSYVDLLKQVSELIGSENADFHNIEQNLEELRKSSLPGRASVLLIEPSPSRRKLCQGLLNSLGVRVVVQQRGMPALEQLLHEPFDLLVAARELPDLNTVAIVSALRESNSRNKHIPVILVSSNSTPIPDYLMIHAVLARDAQFIPNLNKEVGTILHHKK